MKLMSWQVFGDAIWPVFGTTLKQAVVFVYL